MGFVSVTHMMADAILNLLADKLTTLLAEEAKLLSDVHDNVTSLTTDLRFMHLFLSTTQSQCKHHHPLLPELLSQLRNAAHQAEDIVDAYVAEMIKRRRRSRLRAVAGSVDHALMLRNVALKIEGIKTRINHIFENNDRFGITIAHHARGEADRIRRQRNEVEEDKVAGFESFSRAVIDRLLARGSGLKVVSIIGVGGLGKTTLARKIYNNKDRVRDMFPCRAWGYVSNDFRPREFFLSLLNSLLSKAEYSDVLKRRESNDELKIKVRECLDRTGKYLVVVDDVWETRVWDEIKTAFPDTHNGSRILITTRIAKVASHTGPTPPYVLPFLNHQKSWELLFKRVFRGRSIAHLEPLGRSIAQNCDGLPLAIITMAGILSNNISPNQWSGIKDHMNWHLGRDTDPILKLSYDHLPSYLKPCFLYFGMFPQDYNIHVNQLIRLWISEGLLTQEYSSNKPDPEYIAEHYLAELVDRSLVQVIHRTTDGTVKTCRLHRVLRHLCISESNHDEFFQICGNIKDSQTHTRRLSLQGTLFDSSYSSDSSVSGTHSLLCFGQEVSEVKPEHWTWLLKTFKLARVLDLGKMNVSSLHGDFKNLIHLRYLRIHSQNLETIPDTICGLWNLETLDLRGSPIKSFSGELWQLKQLRNLLMLGPVGLRLPENETMPNLQTLSTVALDPHTASLFENAKFPALKKLGLHYEKRNLCDPRVQLQSIHHLSYLKKLKLVGTTEIPQNAENVFPSSITKITLTKFGSFNCGAMNTLGKLPNLVVLKLSSQESNASFDLHCAAGRFPKLQAFVMVGVMVKSWRVEEGSMPSIGRVVLGNCEYLNELPKELWSLTTLSQVNVSWPSTELAKTLQNLEVKNKRKLVVYPCPTR